MSQQTQEPFEEFMEVIRELTSLAGAIAGVEEAKAEAAAQKRHQFLDGFIQEEQAQILKLRGLEQRRLRLAKALGWESLTFRQILEKAPPRQSLGGADRGAGSPGHKKMPESSVHPS